MIRNILHTIGTLFFIFGGVSLGPKAVHPAFAYVAIYVILYAGFMGPREMLSNQDNTAGQAVVFAWFVGLPIMAAQWLLTH